MGGPWVCGKGVGAWEYFGRGEFGDVLGDVSCLDREFVGE